MGILSGIGRYTGGLLLFIFLSSFIFLFAVNSSRILTPSYTTKILDSIVSSSNLSSPLTSANISALESKYNLSSTGVLGLLAGPRSSGTGGLLFSFLSSSRLYEEEYLSLLLAAAGFLLVFFSSRGSSRFKNTGKTFVSVSILTAATVFGIFYVFLPLFRNINISGVTVKIPVSLFLPFTSQVFLASAVLAAAGIGLLVAGFALGRGRNKAAAKR